MAKAVLFPVVALVASAFVAGCSSTGKPAICSSVNDLKSAVTNLQNTDFAQNGLSALQSNLAAVNKEVTKVGQDAKGQYSSQVTEIRSHFASLQSAIRVAEQSRSATDISGAVTAAKTLGTSVQALANDVKSTC